MEGSQTAMCTVNIVKNVRVSCPLCLNVNTPLQLLRVATSAKDSRVLYAFERTPV